MASKPTSEDKQTTMASSTNGSTSIPIASPVAMSSVVIAPAPAVSALSGENGNGSDDGPLGVMRSCLGNLNKTVTWGCTMDQGRRSSMEDEVAIFPEFMSLRCGHFGGCTSLDCREAMEKSRVLYFAVFDGHGGPQVSNFCANELHKMVAEEWEREGAGGGWNERWEVAFSRAYRRADDTVKDKSIAPYLVGSTALVVVVSPCQIIASNCGDSRAVLCQRTQTIPLTVDQKPDRADEVARITKGGGKILHWNGLRVEGVLSMTRAIGDQCLKQWVTSVPEVTFLTRNEDDECLILASDGLWDVMSTENVGDLARAVLRRMRRLAVNQKPSAPAQSVADSLLKAARLKSSSDNIAVIVVDLKPPRRKHHL